MANRVGTFSGSTNGTTAQWTELGGGGGAGVIPVGVPSDYPWQNEHGAFLLEGVQPGDRIMIQAIVASAERCTPQGSLMLCVTVPNDVEKTPILLCYNLDDSSVSETFIASVTEVTATGVYFEIFSMDGTGLALVNVEQIWKMPM